MHLSYRILVPTLTVMATKTVAAMVVGAAPQSMQLTESLQANLPAVYDGDLLPLDFTVGVQEGNAVKFDTVARGHAQARGSIAFVVRRPG